MDQKTIYFFWEVPSKSIGPTIHLPDHNMHLMQCKRFVNYMDEIKHLLNVRTSLHWQIIKDKKK